jgi:hypothetical protein
MKRNRCGVVGCAGSAGAAAWCWCWAAADMRSFYPSKTDQGAFGFQVPKQRRVLGLFSDCSLLKSARALTPALLLLPTCDARLLHWLWLHRPTHRASRIALQCRGRPRGLQSTARMSPHVAPLDPHASDATMRWCWCCSAVAADMRVF